MRRKLVLPLFLVCAINSSFSQPVHVEMSEETVGSFTLMRDDMPYYIMGGGTGDKSRFAELAARGGNSIRTWGVDAASGSLLKEADKHGLTVMLGLWMNKERDGFDYSDSIKVKAQLENFRSYVRAFRNYPALIAWSIGNEVEIGATNLQVWNAVNDISKMIHEEDTNHLTLTVTASISTSKANAIAERAPDLDLLGVNNYAGISGMHSTIINSNWKKPYIITEWGVNGPWEVGKTSWGAPHELNSSEKADLIQSRYENYIAPYGDLIPGSYAFYWNSKFEATETWFGFFVNNETTEMIDVLQHEWSGEWAENKAPQISKLTFNSQSQESNLKITTRLGNVVNLEATDPEGDTLMYEFLFKPESGSDLVEPIAGASFTAIPGIGGFSDSSSIQVDFEAIHNLKNLRLYALVHDGHGHVATATFPFQTDFAPDDTTTIPVDTTTNIELRLEGLKIFPNPADNIIFLQSNSFAGEVDIRIYNCMGILLDRFDKVMLQGNYAISLEKYFSSAYILEVCDHSGNRRFFKVIRN